MILLSPGEEVVKQGFTALITAFSVLFSWATEERGPPCAFRGPGEEGWEESTGTKHRMDLSVFPQGRKWRVAEQASGSRSPVKHCSQKGLGGRSPQGLRKWGHWPLPLSNHQAQHLAN